jgi:hypothetical protein
MRRFHPGRWRLRSFRIVCGALGTACVVLIASGAYLVSEWNKSTTVGVEDVLSDFRRGTSATTMPEPPATTGLTTGVTPPPPVVEPDPSAPTTTVPTTAVTAPAGFTRPAEGVYAYRASGGETLSIGGAHHDYPSEVFAIVRHTACGYRLEMQVLQEHVDTTEVCLDGARLLLKSFDQRLTFFGQTDSGGWACSPPVVLVDRAAGAGSVQQADCTASPLKASGRATYVRPEPTAVDGTTVEGALVEWRWTASGDATGGGFARWVFDDAGLPLRIQREHSTKSQSVLGPATHAESATFVLQSRSPRR